VQAHCCREGGREREMQIEMQKREESAREETKRLCGLVKWYDML
jgi:hypothetical protein